MDDGFLDVPEKDQKVLEHYLSIASGQLRIRSLLESAYYLGRESAYEDLQVERDAINSLLEKMKALK